MHNPAPRRRDLFGPELYKTLACIAGAGTLLVLAGLLIATGI